MTGTISKSFGYWPHKNTVATGPIAIAPLASFDEAIISEDTADGIEGDWIYAPPAQTVDFMAGGVRTHPYAARIFGLPHTHSVSHAAADSEAHVEFHIWCLSFFVGMRLTPTDAGFVDATPIKPGKLVDFVLFGSLAKCVELAEAFWVANRSIPQRSELVEAAIHALFLAHGPNLLQYERFIYCYTALDACYALSSSLFPPARTPSHAARIQWMCDLFTMPTPDWAKPAPRSSSPIAAIRNATMHEALYMGKPLGFALHGVGTTQNLPLEMEALICRLLVALLGDPNAAYVKTLTNTRQRHGLRLS